MVAVLTEPDADKAATLTSSGEMAFFSFPIEKVEDGPDGEITVTGKATDGSLDSDLQVVDPAWSEKALREWFDTGANVRVQHQHQRDPAGKGVWLQGHQIRARVVEPVAVKLVKAGVLQDFSVGIMNPDIRRGDPKFRHLDPQGKAVNGIITGRDDGLSKIGEVSLVDRGSNFGTKFAMLKAAATGEPEWVGVLTAPDEVVTKVTAPRAYKTVSVDLPKSARIRMSPSDLAKMNTMARRAVVPDVTKVAEPVIPPAPDPDAALKAACDAEDDVLGKGSRTFTAEQRREHASEGTALADGSYPMPDADSVRRAAILIRSRHGNWKAAAKLLARRAKALKIPNPLKQKVAEPEAPKTAKPGKCACTAGMTDGKPCTDCKAGKKKAKALLAKAVAGLDVQPADVAEKKKSKVMCGHCGAKQNSKHVHCPECGGALYPGAMPVATKNHEFACLKCGHDPLDKGEPHCPQCGTENPGYLPQADHQIPANKADDAGKERVTPPAAVTKAKKGKKPKKGKKGKGNPFGGNQAKPFGQKDDDAKDDADQKKATRPAARKGKKKGGKGRSPVIGSVSQDTMGLPPHREPDGMPVEAFEHDTALEDGDHEMKASMRHKALGIDPPLGALHDLTCPAFRPADVAKSHPWASFEMIDTGYWERQALDAASTGDMSTAMDAWNKAAELSRCAVVLKTADPRLLHDIRLSNHSAFVAANKDALKAFRDATPGPGSFPTPSHPMPGQFRRPYISAGHGAESPQAGPARSFPVTEGAPMARDFGREYLTAGHAADSPANSTPRLLPPAQNMEAGNPERMHFEGTMADNARQSLSAMHDHLSRRFPDVCPMSPAMGHTQKPAPGVPESVGAPTPHAAGKSAKPGKKAKAKVTTKARKAAKVTKAAVAEPAPAAPAFDGDAITAAVKAATAPLVKRIGRQDKALRKNAKVLSAIAGQRDTSAAPFRGAGITKSQQASPALAGPVTMAESAEQAQVSKYMRLRDTWRTTTIPEEQEACWQEMQAMLGTAPLTDTSSSGLIPMRRHPMT